MKHLIKFENLDLLFKDILKLRKFFIKLFTSLKYNYKSGYDDYETLFGINAIPNKPNKHGDTFMFSIKYYFKTKNLDLQLFNIVFNLYIDNDLANKNTYSIPEYLKNIKGIEILTKMKNEYEFVITDNIDKVIKRISKEDLELIFKTNKYNL